MLFFNWLFSVSGFHALDKPLEELTSGLCHNDRKDCVFMVQKINPEEASQGEKSGVVRYILAASLLLAVIAVAVVGFGIGG